MTIKPLGRIDQIQRGDLLLISDGKRIVHSKAMLVKATANDGVEVIYNLRRNLYFNVGMYLAGESWAKDVRVVRLAQTVSSTDTRTHQHQSNKEPDHASRNLR